MTSSDKGHVPGATDASGSTASIGLRVSGVVPSTHKTISCTQCRKRKLKCDRGKPSCGTCSRLQHQCVYPEGRMKSTPKRRNVKDLEARLAQVESLLGTEAALKSSRTFPIGNSKPKAHPSTETEDYWDDLGMDTILGDDIYETTNQSSSIPPVPPLIEGQYIPNELIGFGLQENLPSPEIIDELHKIYFDRIHTCMPLLHKYRYLARAHLFPPLGPPICLRYAIWAIAAATSEKFSNYQEVFYQRARKYAEADEIKGQGERFITVSHAQCWSLISSYEAQTMHLSRAWVSGGRSTRLAQMMNLHHLDGGGEDVKQILSPPKDWIELEERRRTFWSIFCCDRYSSAGTGWPMTIDERDITTNLPSSDEAFSSGQMETSTTLSEAMTPEGAARVSSFAGVVLAACLFGHNWIHLHRPGPNDHPEDFSEGEFWKRHRRMDNVLSNTLMFLPERLRLPGSLRDPNVVYLNMNIHSSTICLHQVAILKAERHSLDPRIIKRSQARCRAAAQEIVNILRLISHSNVAEMNAWVAFNLYVASSVLIEGCHFQESSQECRSNLDFLLTALQVIGRKHAVTKAFIAQLEIDLETAGISSPFSETTRQKSSVGHTSPTAVYSMNVNHRVSESSADLLNQSLFSTGISPSVSGGSESCSISEKDSATTPQDPHSTPDMLGILPKQNITARLRRINNYAPLKIDNQHEQNMAYGVQNSFRTAFHLTQYPVQLKTEAERQQSKNIPTLEDGQTLEFLSTFSGQQQFMQTSSKELNMEENPLGPTSFPANAALSNWEFEPVKEPVLDGLADFEFPIQGGDDNNSFLDGTAWYDGIFQA